MSNGSASRPTSKAPRQCDRVLALLRERGASGFTNIEPSQKCTLTYGEKLFELRKQDLVIESRRESETILHFILCAEPAAPKPLPTYAEKTKRLENEPLPLLANVGVR